MSTAASLLMILLFLAAFYTVLALLCGLVGTAWGLVARFRERRRAGRWAKRLAMRRTGATVSRY